MKSDHEKASPKTTLAALLTLREMLSDERNWTKYALRCTLPDGRFSYCLLGGLNELSNTNTLNAVDHRLNLGPTVDAFTDKLFLDYAVASSIVYRGAITALKNVLPAWSKYDLSIFNDHPSTKHSDVMALIDKAILGCS